MAASLCLAAVSCASVDRYDAAGDVHAFLIAIRNGDSQTFNAHVDRPALKEQLKARLMLEAQRRGGAMGALTALMARPLVGVAVDALVQPDVFRIVAETLGYSPDTPIPNRVLIAAVLRRTDSDHVCAPLKRDGPCALVFRNEDGVWRLTDFDADLSMLRPSKGR
ncbi:MAG TPA: DUF2939 domain-containing protein [Caulobacteraceae bacterium]|jgi:hypothetical protein|nr:DUF2939 domain-containing protein [Caulobacteraceae bacterium]